MRDRFWVARDKSGYIALWRDFPYRNQDNEWDSHTSEHWSLSDDEFPQVTWDNEPEEVVLCINNDKYHTVRVELLDKLYADSGHYKKRVINFNKLPWYKRIFRKA